MTYLEQVQETARIASMNVIDYIVSQIRTAEDDEEDEKEDKPKKKDKPDDDEKPEKDDDEGEEEDEKHEKHEEHEEHEDDDDEKAFFTVDDEAVSDEVSNLPVSDVSLGDGEPPVAEGSDFGEGDVAPEGLFDSGVPDLNNLDGEAPLSEEEPGADMAVSLQDKVEQKLEEVILEDKKEEISQEVAEKASDITEGVSELVTNMADMMHVEVPEAVTTLTELLNDAEAITDIKQAAMRKVAMHRFLRERRMKALKELQKKSTKRG